MTNKEKLKAIIDKAKSQGTVELSHRRQRSIVNLVLGGDDWEPTDDELKECQRLFLEAEKDPTGNIIAHTKEFI